MAKLRIFFGVGALIFVVGLHAQEARLTGTITDSTGAVVTGAAITVTHTERNTAFTTASNTVGVYLFPRLPIGPYEIKAEFSGFKTYVQSGVNLTTDSDSLVNIIMEVGALSEQVSVSAQASRVSTETATVQQLVDGRRIVDLPINGRNVYSLALLVPGTGTSGTNIDGGRSGSQNSGMANVRIDGALNVDNAWQQILPSPSPDAVQEFTIQTSNPSARYGYASGVIEISTKSGTNELHGTAYEFLRNQDLDARNFFLAAKTNRKRNQYGFTLGGPVFLPKLYNGRNRTFWFVNFEQQKESLGAATTIYVPTAAQLSGDFSASSVAIKDPLTNQPFPGKQIPASRLDPLALNFIQGYVPSAQDSRGTYVYQRPTGSAPSQVLARGDQFFGGGKQQLSFRVFSTRITNPTGSGNLPVQQNGESITNTDLFGLTYVAVLAPNKINTARVSLNHWYTFSIFEPKISLTDLKKLGFADNYYTYTPDFPTFTISGGFTSSVDCIYIPRNFHTLSWSDDFSWVHSKHTVQFGVDGIQTFQKDDNRCRSDGSFAFDGSQSGVGLSDFLIGRPSQFRQENLAPDDLRGRHFAWYVQDDFKVSSRLTLNLGLRYELPLPTLAVNDAAMLYRAGAQSQVFPNAPPGLLFYGDPGVPRAGRTASTKLFAPSIGISYGLTSDQKTVVRAGYGIHYNPAWSNETGQFAIYQPFTRTITLLVPPSTANPWANYPGGNPFPYIAPAKNRLFDPDITSLTYGPNFTELAVQQWNLNIQREIVRDWLFTAGYVGSRGTHIPYLRDMNVPVYVPGQSTVANTDQRRPMYPYFSRFSSIESVINSSYNSLIASVDKRLSRNFSVQMAYTFSKNLTDGDSVLTNTGGETDPFNRRLDWAPASFDVAQNFVFSWIWDVPSGNWRHGAKGFVAANWQVNGIWGMHTGTPVQITASQDRALYGRPNRPDRIRDPRLSTSRPRAQLISEYFDPAAYVVNQPGTFGSAPRSESQLRSPGSETVTLGVFKGFRGLRESHKVQFRSEFFNLLNRPNFGAPGSSIDSASSFGRITSAGDGRFIELGLKYLF
jgi:hypothetical protein